MPQDHLAAYEAQGLLSHLPCDSIQAHPTPRHARPRERCILNHATSTVSLATQFARCTPSSQDLRVDPPFPLFLGVHPVAVSVPDQPGRVKLRDQALEGPAARAHGCRGMVGRARSHTHKVRCLVDITIRTLYFIPLQTTTSARTPTLTVHYAPNAPPTHAASPHPPSPSPGPDCLPCAAPALRRVPLPCIAVPSSRGAHQTAPNPLGR